MGTQESSSEGIPAGRDMQVDGGDGTADDHAADDSPSETEGSAEHNGPEPARPEDAGSQHTGSDDTGPDSTGPEPGGSHRSGTEQRESEHAGPHRHAGQPIEAHFANPSRQKPQRYNRGRSKVHPTTPLDPITPYMAGPVPRRRKSDWPILVFALVVAAIVMATCCVAGFAIFRTYGLSL